MIARLSLREAANHMLALPGNPFAGVTVDTFYAHDYLLRWAKVSPAVWFLGQRLTNLDDGRAVQGYSSIKRQRMRVEIALRIIVARSVEGVIDSEPAMNTLHNKVAEGMFAWKITGAEQDFSISSVKDGVPYESIVAADLMFTTVAMFSKP